MQSTIGIVSKMVPIEAAAAESISFGGPPGMQQPFEGFLQKAAQDMDSLRSDANRKVSGLITGNGTDLHTALIATQKADLAFDYALATRNKAISAYQQLMSTQF